MKPISLLTVGLLLAAFVMTGQVTPVSTSSAAARSESTTLSDREKNIQAYVELMRRDLRQRKAQITGLVMQLDANDSAKFWPVYQEFEVALALLYDKVAGLVKDYAAKYESITNPAADELANKLLDLEQQRNELKRKYYERFKAALDSVAAVRFLQVENQIERLIDLQISAELPVVERSQP